MAAGELAMDDKKSTRFSLDELARQLAESVPQNLKVLGQDLERNFKTLLQSGIERMELVSREEFDVQRAVLERTRSKLEAMEARLADLEKALSSRS
jgi:BMFP domain-containing protein YqiC